MDSKQKRTAEGSLKSSSCAVSEHQRNPKPDQQFLPFDPRNVRLQANNDNSFPEFSPPVDALPQGLHPPRQEVKNRDQLQSNPLAAYLGLEWDPMVMLNNLSFLEQKIHQVQEIVRSMINQEGQFSNRANELAAQQQLVTADLTCIIIQLISTAGTLLPNMKSSLISADSAVLQPVVAMPPPTSLPVNNNNQQNDIMPTETAKSSEYDEIFKSFESCNGERDELFKCLSSSGCEVSDPLPMEDHDVKDYEDGMDGENLPPESYEVLQLEKEEILAPHTHFCQICGKGFKRDANLRMHMRGHGDQYKTPAALSKPAKEAGSELAPIRRYSCPFVGCKRNKEHKKFQPLKTILCVKNHYKRTHCDKSYTCSRCNTKKFSVIADLKTHEKHCGRDKWLCSCGTTFSRKDKLFGHVALFQGHTPALPIDDVKVSGTPDQDQGNQMINGLLGSMDYSFVGSSSIDVPSIDKKAAGNAHGFFSPMNFDSCNFGGLDNFSHTAFEVSESPFSFLPTGSCSFLPRDGEN